MFLVTCVALSLDNGQVGYHTPVGDEGYTVDTVAYFSCAYGFVLSGSSSTICQTSGNWNPEPPMCFQSN